MNSENPYKTPEISTQPSFDQSMAQSLTIQSILFSFKGRIPRRVYWGASIATTIVFYVVIFGLIFVFGEDSLAVTSGIMLLYIPLIWVSLALQVKRWHDRDKSGWWILIGFIPLIGAIWAFVELGCLRGTGGPNSYGPDPT
jgi:uncharacterized membrane protein YhaH (DUF805 family)